jgi:ubiquitin thioesterase OTU1
MEFGVQMSLRLRLKAPNGTNHTVSYASTMCLAEFIDASKKMFGSPQSDEVELLTGFPPKLVTAARDTPLSDFASSGDTIVFRVVKQAQPAQPNAAPAASASSPPGPISIFQDQAGASEWSCPVCTLKNEASSNVCDACGGARPGGGRVPLASSYVSSAGGCTAEIVPMADDNSCLFHGIAFLLADTRTERNAFPAELRASIVRAVQADPIRWNEGTLGKSVADYCSFIKDSRRWGGEVELAIFAEMYSAEISVTNVENGRADVYGQGSNYSQRCYLIYTGTHFDAAVIVGASGGQRSKTTSTADTSAADVAGAPRVFLLVHLWAGAHNGLVQMRGEGEGGSWCTTTAI